EFIVYAPDVNTRFSDIERLYSTRNEEEAMKYFDKYKINYILITPEMKRGLVWHREDEGLLHVIKNNEKIFKRIYTKKGIEIWQVVR
ncbi:hypothetical protein K8R47_03230, partial [archaeon]|nr:hypothetical protein [archaeon]